MIQTSRHRFNQFNERENRLMKTMFATFRPIHCTSRIFGLMPFTIVCNSDGEVQSLKVKTVDGIWFTVSICTYLFFVIFNYDVLRVSAHYYRKSVTLILIEGNYTLPWLSFVCVTVFFVVNMCNRRKYFDILKMFEQFDKEASQPILFNHLISVYLIVIYFNSRCQN